MAPDHRKRERKYSKIACTPHAYCASTMSLQSIDRVTFYLQTNAQMLKIVRLPQNSPCESVPGKSRELCFILMISHRVNIMFSVLKNMNETYTLPSDFGSLP